jgi:hypothetical protein
MALAVMAHEEIQRRLVLMVHLIAEMVVVAVVSVQAVHATAVQEGQV